MRRVAVIGLALAMVALLAGCKIDARVSITWETDGSGTVDVRLALDKDAVTRLETGGHTLDDVQVDDLADAGWKVLPWVRTENGGATISASHGFRGEEQLASLLTDLTGSPGIVRDAEFTHDRGLVESRDGLAVTVDMRQPLRSIEADQALTAKLQAAGIDTKALDGIFREEARNSLSMTLVLDGPHGASRTTRLVAGQTEALSTGDSQFHADRLVGLLIAAMLGFLAILLYLAISITSRRARRQGTHRILWDDEPLM